QPETHESKGAAAALAAAALLAACGGGGGSSGPGPTAVGASTSPSATPPSRRDAARFLSQASFGATGPEQVDALVAQGFDAWLTAQFAKPTAL
ncbi:hypothetical protein ABTK21_19420, partial [Acinetobacter baumannii]